MVVVLYIHTHLLFTPCPVRRVFFRYMVVGLYVGFATVGSFAYWYIAYDWSEYGQPLISFQHLANWCG